MQPWRGLRQGDHNALSPVVFLNSISLSLSLSLSLLNFESVEMIKYRILNTTKSYTLIFKF
jgi:hypothetical protein